MHLLALACSEREERGKRKGRGQVGVEKEMMKRHRGWEDR